MRAILSLVAMCVAVPLGAQGVDRHLPRAALDAERAAGRRRAGEHHASAGLRQSAVVHARQPRDPLHVDARGRPVRHLSRRHRDARPITRVTTTPESEYSATVMPGGKRFSVIRVEKDSTQRLWSFALDGSDPRVVLETLKPVGYHAWIDANNLALFVLGRPNALVHADVRTQKSDTLARSIGRSLAPLPGARGFSFVRQVDSASTLVAATWPGFATRDLVALPRGSQDIVWLTPKVVLVGRGSRVMAWTAGEPGWATVGDLADAGLTDITRLAASPDGHWLAIVAEPAGETKP